MDFLRYRIEAPKDTPNGEMLSLLEPGSHLLSNDEANYCIAFIGDVLPLGGKQVAISEELQDFLSDADAIVVNLEGVITGEKRFLAQSHGEEILGLIRSLISGEIIINLANNHSSDFGKDGFDAQVKLLEGREFSHLLGFKGKRVTLNNNIVLHAASYWSNQNILTSHRFSYDELVESREGDGLYHIFLPHWGYEMELYPRVEQVKYANQLLRHGWDSIVGNHPHCPQVMQLKENKLVAYSLGNFCYDNINPNHWYGMALKMYFNCIDGCKPKLVQLKSTYTLQDWNGDQLAILATDILDYQRERRHIKYALPYLKDLLK